MNTFLAVVLGLTIASDLRGTNTLYQNQGTLVPDAQLISNIYVRKDATVKLEAKGNGRGDLDCYLLHYVNTRDVHGWGIASKDESNMDQCSVSYTPSIAEPLRLWVVNHGVHPTTYTVHVEQ